MSEEGEVRSRDSWWSPDVIDAAGKRYVVEAALPMSALGLTPSDGLTLRADFGVTHGDKDGRDTVLRSYWSNQNTGLVSDEVYELQMFPSPGANCG